VATCPPPKYFSDYTPVGEGLESNLHGFGTGGLL